MKSKVSLKNNISTDTVNEDIYGFGNDAAPLVDNNGLHMVGGITNTQETETTLPTGKSFFTDDGKRITVSSYAADTVDVSIDGRSMGQLPEYGVETKVEVSSTYDDVSLTADGTYITAKLFGNAVTLSEYDFDNVLLHSRIITFTNIGSIAQYVTSFSIVKYQGMHYTDSAEFAIRIGDQILIAPESNPGVSLGKYFQSSAVIGSNNVLCSAIYNGMLIIAGVGGRLGSYDGNAWRNYDGSGLGQGPASNAVAIGANDINCMIVYNGLLVVAGASGRVASYDGVSWRNYDGTGGSYSVIYDNGTLIGANAIKCMGVWNNTIVFGGVGGRIGCIYNGATKYLYTATVTTPITNTFYSPITSNATVCGANDITAMATIIKNGIQTLCVSSTGGRIASYDNGWIYYNNTRQPVQTAVWSSRATGATYSIANKIVYGNGVYVGVSIGSGNRFWPAVSSDGVNYTNYDSGFSSPSGGCLSFGNGLFVYVKFIDATTSAVLTSPDGKTWTQRTNPATVYSFSGIAYNDSLGLFAVIATGTTSTTQALMTSPDGINWTMRTTPAAISGWAAIAAGGNAFMAVGQNTSTTNGAMTSTDGINWSLQTTPAPASNWADIAYNSSSSSFVALCNSTSTTQSLMINSGSGWSLTGSPATTSTGWRSIAAGDGYFIMVSSNGIASQSIASSATGIGWTAQSQINSGYIISYANNAFLSINTGAILSCLKWNANAISNNSTVVSTDNITAMFNYNNDLIVASALGKVANYTTGWSEYNGFGLGVQPYNNATVLGAVSINDILLFGTNLLFAGATSRIGSWDGTNWKNYDGTGTGTGQYTQSILGAQNINGFESYNGMILAGGGGGVVNSMTAANVVSPFYNVSGLPVAQNILVGQISAGYLDAFRYENGLYLLGVVGNNLNKYYVLNNSTLDLVVLNGKYALVQYSAGKSRHIVTESPRFDAGRMYFISLVGYTDFITFSAIQVYPADSSILSSVLNSQVGWNYVDMTYKLTSSATSIFNAIAPVAVPSTAALYKTYQSNTNTLTTAYGKLNNASGVPSTKPFEFRLNWLNSGVSTVGSQQFISVASIDGGISDSLGVIITDVGAFDESYTPQIVNDDTIMYRYQGKWYIIKISKNIATRLQRIASTLYKVNTISPLNVIDTTFETLNVGSCDYQGRMQFTSAVVPAATNSKCVSVFTGKYSNSIDNGDRLVQIPSLSSNNIDLIGFRIPNTNRVIQDYSIDTYINDTYAFTTYNDASEFVQGDPVNPLYLPNSNLPVPIGGIYNNGAVTSKSLTVFLRDNYDGYEIGNDLPYAYTPFSLFGQKYLFDGLTIYLANIQNNVLQSVDRICDAYGMKFMAVTPSEAFLLSDFDNSMYSFNGGRTLVKSKAFTTLDIINSGIWSTIDGTMLLDAANSFIWVRDGIVTKMAKKATQTNLKFYTTKNGIIISNDIYSWQYTYYPQVGSVPIPLSFQTAYLGQENNQLSILKRWIITIYNENRSVLHVTTVDKSKDQDCQYSNTTHFVINSSDYDSLGYAHIRVTPKHPRALGSSIIIQIAELAAVLDVSAEWEDAANAAISAGKSR